MNILEALKAIEALYPTRDDVAGDDNTHRLTSGGEGKSLFQEPALWASPELACEAFKTYALAFLRAKNAAGIRVLDGPHLDKWQITVTDAKNTHRIGEPRWSVTCKIAVFADVAAETQAA